MLFNGLGKALPGADRTTCLRKDLDYDLRRFYVYPGRFRSGVLISDLHTSSNKGCRIMTDRTVCSLFVQRFVEFSSFAETGNCHTLSHP